MVRVPASAASSDVLMRLFDAAVRAVSGAEATRRGLSEYPDQPAHLLAIGKAAGSMTLGAIDALADRLISGMVISKYNHLDPALTSDARLQCIESAHPVPDQNSLMAAEAVFAYIDSLPAEACLVVLLSGGASSLMESLPAAMTLQDLQRVNVHLLSAGLDIKQMNQVRRSLSTIKGGRLATRIGQRSVLQLLISDVPGDSLNAIGSGPLVIPGSDDLHLPALPAWLMDLMGRSPPAPAAGHPVWAAIETRIVASNAVARQATAEYSEAAGFRVVQQDGLLTGDVVDMAASIAAVLSNPNAEPGVYIWGGETTVQLPPEPGRGGRNQQLALELALAMSPTTGWSALCCGTDGTDGPTGDAGGLVDHTTLVRAQELGLDARACAQAANAGDFLQRTDTLVTTGPTGTNVMDVVIALRH